MKNDVEIKERYQRILAQNLPVLRAKLDITQTELAEMIGVTRQTINAIESGSRLMTWCTFMALVFLFSNRRETSSLLSVLGIDTPELKRLLRIADISRLLQD